MAMLAILAACHGYFACGNKVLFCSVLVPRTRTTTGQCSFVVNGPRTWNSLPADPRTPDTSLCSFKRHLKAHLFQQLSTLLLESGLNTVRPAPLWLYSEFGADYKCLDLLTYLLTYRLCTIMAMTAIPPPSFPQRPSSALSRYSIKRLVTVYIAKYSFFLLFPYSYISAASASCKLHQ